MSVGEIQGVESVRQAQVGVIRHASMLNQGRASRAVSEALARKQQAVSEAMDLLQEMSADSRTNLNIHVDKETGIFVIRVLSARTGELIRQIPQSEVINAIRNILRNAGVIIDRTA